MRDIYDQFLDKAVAGRVAAGKKMDKEHLEKDLAGGRVWITPEGTKYFAGDLSEQEQKLVWATHYPPAADLLEQQKLDEVAWESKPSWYILAQKDQTVHPDLQRFLAKRMNATTVETDSSHVIMLSQPDVVIEVIRRAAAAVQKR